MLGSSPEVVSVPETTVDDDEEGDDEVEDPTSDNDPPEVDVDERWGDLQAFIARCEAEEIELYGLEPTEIEAFVQRRSEIEKAAQNRALASVGIDDYAAWQRTVKYFEAKWSRLHTARDGTRTIGFDERFVQAQAAVKTR